MEQEPIKQPWIVEVEMLENDMFYRAGQEISDTVMAIDKQDAIQTLANIYSIQKENFKVKTAVIWNE